MSGNMLSCQDIVTSLQQLAQDAEGLLQTSPTALADQLTSLANQARKHKKKSTSIAPDAADGNAVEGKNTDDAEARSSGAGPGPSSELTASEGQPSKKRKQGPREFDFGKYKQRYVALEVMYIGWKFHGFARQDNTDNTIEGHLFRALKKSRLIPEDAVISDLKYSRCGRTDKGVSALGQVVALLLRSNQKVGGEDISLEQEIDYPRTINKALPPEIRVLGWTPAPDTFHARFSARYREYKYFIVQSPSNPLDIGRMQQAAGHLVGAHDYRNFCKLDVLAVKSFDRRILSFSIDPVPVSGSGAQVYAMTIRGTAFLWHQVRCMAAVLLMVGQGLEEPGIVQRLLDIEATPRKPQYQMASEEPLLLYACGFEGLEFIRHPRLQEQNVAQLAAAVEQHLVGAALTGAALARVASDSSSSSSGSAAGAGGAAGAVGNANPAGVAANKDAGLGASPEAGIDTAMEEAAVCSSSAQRQQQGQQQGQRLLHWQAGTQHFPESSAVAAAIAAAAAAAREAGSTGHGAAYIPLIKRATEPSVEEKMRKHGLPWPPAPLGLQNLADDMAE